MKINTKLKDKDLGWKFILKETKKFSKSYTTVGYFTSNGNPTTDIATRAIVNEYGATIPVTKKMKGFMAFKFGVFLKKKTIRIPSRPFMKKTFDKNKTLIYKQIYKEYFKITEIKQTAKKALSRLGEWYSGLIKITILKGGFAPNSSFTMKTKGSTKPLIDTAELLNSIRHKEVLK